MSDISQKIPFLLFFPVSRLSQVPLVVPTSFPGTFPAPPPSWVKVRLRFPAKPRAWNRLRRAVHNSYHISSIYLQYTLEIPTWRRYQFQNEQFRFLNDLFYLLEKVSSQPEHYRLPAIKVNFLDKN